MKKALAIDVGGTKIYNAIIDENGTILSEVEKNNKRVRICNAIAMLLVAGYTILKDTAIYNDNAIVMAVTDFAQGLAIGMLLVGVIMLSRYGARIRAFKQRLLKKPITL